MLKYFLPNEAIKTKAENAKAVAMYLDPTIKIKNFIKIEITNKREDRKKTSGKPSIHQTYKKGFNSVDLADALFYRLKIKT